VTNANAQTPFLLHYQCAARGLHCIFISSRIKTDNDEVMFYLENKTTKELFLFYFPVLTHFTQLY
jgi:hypothetical protein